MSDKFCQGTNLFMIFLNFMIRIFREKTVKKNIEIDSFPDKFFQGANLFFLENFMIRLFREK